MPLPSKVIPWEGSPHNPAGIPYIITEFAQGAEVAARWASIQGADALAALVAVFFMETALMHDTFAQYGSLFFREDVPEALRDRPLLMANPSEDWITGEGRSTLVLRQDDVQEYVRPYVEQRAEANAQQQVPD
ncbi:hypothetical protein C2E23DRAFT_823684 [Lenzites betulinus]|nr:hypothetical protein C2E23DRAFT_823684 [Lenzites betulinus]